MTLTGSGAKCPRPRQRCSVLFVMLTLLLLAAPAFAQTTLSGIVHDPSGRVAVDVPVIVEDQATGRRWDTRSSDIGHYEFKQLPPGAYRVIVELPPFKPHVVEVVVSTGRRATLDIALQLASEERVNVESETLQPPIEADAAGPATFAREVIEALPLPNGRTAQSLQALVPGVVFTDSVGTLAQFTAVGQRRFANRMTIDGISADLAVDLTGVGIGQSGSGSLPATSTLGGTQTLVPLAAIEEIQVRTTNATPEYQRTPGAQTSVVTRAGGNHLTGSAFVDYRPHQLTASDWFANNGQGPRRRVALGNGGASAGGPIVKNRVFYFASWERQEIDRPTSPAGTNESNTVTVPSIATRQMATPEQRAVLDAYPLPNGPENQFGMAQVTREFPLTSKLWTMSLRTDAVLSGSHRLFARVNVGRSKGDALTLDYMPFFSMSRTERTSTDTGTIGLTSTLSSSLTHDLRLNISRNAGTQENGMAPYGDAQPLPFDLLTPPGASPADTLLFVFIPAVGGQVLSGPLPDNSQRQLQLADTWSFVTRRHDWRFGVDYRQLTAATDPQAVEYDYRFTSVSQLLSGRMRTLNVQNFMPARVRVQAWSAFVQDAIRVSPRMSVNVGVRYSVNPAPSSLTDTNPLLVRFETLPERQTLPEGSSLWNTSWTNLSPQVGATYQLSSAAGRETVLRTSWGLAFDDLAAPGAVAFGRSYPFAKFRSYNLPSFPAPMSLLTAAPAAAFATGDSSEYFAFPRSFKSPRTYSWQVGLERAVGHAQRIGLAYVGAAGRDLVYWSTYNTNGARPIINAYSNDATSDYNALLAEYVRRLSHGFQARVAYTWSHSLDTDSGESPNPHLPTALASPDNERASSDFDRRHVLQAVASYRLPNPQGPALLRALGSDWQLDVAGTFRSGAPFTVTGAVPGYVVRPDVVPGQPVWLGDPASVTGWTLNADAFKNPEDEVRQGTLGRNTLRSSPLRQIDFALSRTARFGGRWTAQVRIEAFNVFNTVNAGPPPSSIINVPFGRPIRTYAETLGVGTLSLGGVVPVQQVGGPRSLQLGVRLRF